jgi:hypothetical protein
MQTSYKPSQPKRIRSENPKFGIAQGSSAATAESTDLESEDVPSMASPGAVTEPHGESAGMSDCIPQSQDL